MNTIHKIIIGTSQNMFHLGDNSIDLIVTSPPYPMIKMWDDIMAKQNPDISYIDIFPKKAFNLMHKELDKVWMECFRVLKNGGFLCINIGDATRTINENFSLYDNHSKVSQTCENLGFVQLPSIIWRKRTNAPNKFMGSGTLPCGAYVTLEHEWILVFRKGSKREYKTQIDKLNRMKSAFFWEERNVWFSDVWEITGTRQTMQKSGTRDRSAAFPFEIPFRLINMFSQKGDVVLDPFLGTGTTTQAAILTGRNSIGYEIDPNLEPHIMENIDEMDIDSCNNLIMKRLKDHIDFINGRESTDKEVKHFNKNLNCKVMTKQETEIELNFLKFISRKENGEYVINYEDRSISFQNNPFTKNSKQ